MRHGGSGSLSLSGSSKWVGGGRPARRPLLLTPQPGILVYCLLAMSLAMNSLWISGRLKLTGKPSTVTGNQLLLAALPCGSVNVSGLHDHLRDVVLVINFDEEELANKAVISMLRGLYGRIFDTIVFLGPREDSSIGLDVRANRPWAQNGSYAYFYFPKLVARYPQAAGYLWMDEHVQLNYWHLAAANKSKIWSPESPSCCRCPCGDVVSFTAQSSTDESIGHCEDSDRVRQQAQVAVERLEESYQAAYNWSLGEHKGGYPRRAANIFYIPSRLSLQFAFDLHPVFRDLGVPQEAAVPMMLRALEPPQEYDKVLNSFKCFRGRDASPELLWKWSYAGVAPWSLESAGLRSRLIEMVRKYDTCVQRPWSSPPSSKQ